MLVKPMVLGAAMLMVAAVGCLPPISDGGEGCGDRRQIYAVAVRIAGAYSLRVPTSLVADYESHGEAVEGESVHGQIILYDDEDRGQTYKFTLHCAGCGFPSKAIPVRNGHLWSGSLTVGETLTLYEMPLPSGAEIDMTFDVVEGRTPLPVNDGAVTLIREPTTDEDGEFLRFDLDGSMPCG